MITIVGLAVLCVLLVTGLFWGAKRFSGVRVKVANRNSHAMQRVSVEVTGVSYQIGDIQAGASKSVKVRPRSASGVTIKYSDIRGKQHNLYIDTYIERDYFFGHINAQVKDGKIIHLEQDSKITLFF